MPHHPILEYSGNVAILVRVDRNIVRFNRNIKQFFAVLMEISSHMALAVELLISGYRWNDI